MRDGLEDVGHASAQAPEPSDLPPLRGWVIPTVPRAAVQREAAAAAERLKELEAAGANSRRIRKAAQRKLAAEEKLRVAGGPTSRSLLWQIKAEEDKVEQAIKSMDKERAEQKEKEQQIQRLGEEIRASHALVERLEERKREATERLRYLSNQKWVESIPPEWIGHFRALERTLGTACPEAHPMVVALLDLMVPPPEDYDICGDTSSSSEGEGSDGDGSSATRPEASDMAGEPRVEGGGSAGEVAAYAALLEEAEEELEKLRAAWLGEKARAQSSQLSAARGAPKRTREGEEVRVDDADADVEMVAQLTVEQVDQSYRGRCDGLVATIGQLRQRIAEAELVPLPTPGQRPSADLAANAADGVATPGPGPSRNALRPPLARRGSRGQQADARAVRNDGTAGGSRAHSPVGAGEGEKGKGRGTGEHRAADGRRDSSAPVSRGRSTSTLPCTRLVREQAVADVAMLQQQVLDDHRRDMHDSAAVIQAQEAMQVQQEKERAQAVLLAEAKAAIEARCGGALAQTDGPPPPASPAYGPTGQRWDQPQGVLHHATRLRAQEEVVQHLQRQQQQQQRQQQQLQVPGADDVDDADTHRPRQRCRWTAGEHEGLPAAFRGRTTIPAAFRGRRWHSLGDEEREQQCRSSRSPRPEAATALRARFTRGPGEA